MNKKKYIPLYLSITLAIVALACYTFSRETLAHICEDYAMDALENNPIELHYSIAYPDELGLSELSTDLSPYTSTYYSSCITTWEDYISRLHELDTSSFSSTELLTYDLLLTSATKEFALLQFPHLDQPLSSFSGIHNQLPILLAEYTFRSTQDIDNYLALLEDIPAYFEGLILYTQEQADAGILLNKADVQESISQCLSLFPIDEINSNTCFLLKNFEGKLQSLCEASVLTTIQASEYIEKHKEYLRTYVSPSYLSLATALKSLPVREELLGLSHYEQGANYYEVLLQSKIGTRQTIPELKAMLYEDFDQLYEAYHTLVANNALREPSEFPLSTPSDILDYLCESLTSTFPSLPVNDASLVIEVKEVDESIQSMSAPAFYMIPPIDSTLTNTIYVNPSFKLEGLDLFSTLAHEGFPGHLYQTVYSQLSLEQENAPLARKLLYHGGFTEGWGIYSELYSYNFALKLLPEDYREYVLYECLSRKIQLCLSSILDIAIHYEGATVSEIELLLEKLGFNKQIAPSLYESICFSPGNYPMYYVGYLNIEALKKSARELWDSSYTDLLFHTWLLETGGGDFPSLIKDLHRQ